MSASTAERRLATFIARFDPPIARAARSARAKLRRLVPGAIELVYDNYNALAIGFGPNERASDAIFSIAVWPRWVSLFFLQGAALRDRAGLLRGKGTRARHIVLQGGGDLDRPAVTALVRAALAGARVPIDASRRRRVVIKSVSARQRPRRAGGRT
jgi:hypothetical protein